MERIDRLKQLQGILSQDDGDINWNIMTDLEQYFLGQRTGCQCKRSTVKSSLNNFWESQGKKELYG